MGCRQGPQWLSPMDRGAALSNIIFAQPGTVVLEIPLRPFNEGPYFKRMAEALGLCYGDTAESIAVRYISSLVLDEFKIAGIISILRETLVRCESLGHHRAATPPHESL